MAFNFPQNNLAHLSLALPPVTPNTTPLSLPSPQTSPMDVEKVVDTGVRPQVALGHGPEGYSSERFMQPTSLAPGQRPHLGYYPQVQPAYAIASSRAAGLEAGADIASEMMPAHGVLAERKRQEHANNIKDIQARQTMWDIAERQTWFVKTLSALVDNLLSRINVQTRTNNESARTVDDIISLYNSMRLFLENKDGV